MTAIRQSNRMMQSALSAIRKLRKNAFHLYVCQVLTIKCDRTSSQPAPKPHGSHATGAKLPDSPSYVYRALIGSRNGVVGNLGQRGDAGGKLPSR
jgi:hypothetical protein